MTRKGFFLSFALLLIVLFAAMSACAAQEGNATAEHAAALFKWINFLIVVAILAWVFLKLTPPLFRRNAEAISSAITKATAVKAEADRQFREAESKLAHLQNEINDLRVTAQQEAAAEAERIRSVTRSDAEKVAVAAKAEIEAAERAARLELKARAAEQAVRGAEDLLVRQLTPQTQESLVASFVKSLEGRPN